MRRLKPVLLVAVAAGLVAAGVAVVRGRGGPSAEDAKQAILDHIAAHPGELLAIHTPRNMAEIPVERHGDYATWGPFGINLRERTFELFRVYGETKPHAVGVKGRFVYAGGRWLVEAP